MKLQPCYVHLRDLREGEVVHTSKTVDLSADITFDMDAEGKVIGVEFGHVVDVEISGVSLRDDTSL